MNIAIKENEDKNYIDKIIETISYRTDTGKNKLSLNFAEFIFIRRSGVAW